MPISVKRPAGGEGKGPEMTVRGCDKMECDMPSEASSSHRVEITDRDLQILRGFFEARVMTAEHVAAIYFGGRHEAARKRLAKLKTAGYVGERPRRPADARLL